MSPAEQNLRKIFDEMARLFRDGEGGEAPVDCDALYDQFCALGQLLAPALGEHLQRKGLEAVPEAHPSHKLEKGYGHETPEPIRRYNAHVVARLLLDLRSAIAGAFPNPGNGVHLIAYDLINGEPPIALPDHTKRGAPRGRAGRPHQAIRELARKTLYEVVIYETARGKESRASLLRRLCEDNRVPFTEDDGKGITFTEDNWRSLVEERSAQVDTALIEARGRVEGAPEHPDLWKLTPGLAKAAKS